MRAAFAEKELKDIGAAFMKLTLQKIEFATTLPLSVGCGNPTTPWSSQLRNRIRVARRT
jgi:hypothetical protein